METFLSINDDTKVLLALYGVLSTPHNDRKVSADDGNIYEVNFHFEPDPDDFNNPSKDWLSNIGLTFEEKLTEEEYSLLEQEKFVPRMWDNIIKHLVDEYDIDFVALHKEKYPKFGTKILDGYGDHMQVQFNAVPQNSSSRSPQCVYFLSFRWDEVAEGFKAWEPYHRAAGLL